jgi:hypothetical protein
MAGVHENYIISTQCAHYVVFAHFGCLCEWQGTSMGGRGVYEGARVCAAAETVCEHKRYIMSTQSTHYVPFVHALECIIGWSVRETGGNVRETTGGACTRRQVECVRDDRWAEETHR